MKSKKGILFNTVGVVDLDVYLYKYSIHDNTRLHLHERFKEP